MAANLWKILRPTLGAAGCFLLALLAFHLQPAAAQPFGHPAPFHPIIVDLGAVCGGASHADAVNEDGVVAGSCEVPAPLSGSVQHAGLWYQNRWTDLGTLDDAANGVSGSTSAAFTLNDHGLVAGISFTRTAAVTGNLEIYHATLWANGVVTDLGTLGGARSSANAVNNHGRVAGSSDTAGDEGAAFLWENGAMTELDGRDGSASALNDRGVVAGAIRSTAFYHHAVIWHMDVMTDLGDLGFGSSYENSIAYGINDLGHVVGSSAPPGLASRAFVWVDGVLAPLPSLGGPSTNPGCAAQAINNRGLAVGYCTTPSSILHAVLWDLWDNTTLYLPAIAR